MNGQTRLLTRTGTIAVLVLGTLLALAGLGFTTACAADSAPAPTAAEVTTPHMLPTVPPVAEELSRGFQAVSKAVQPSVVSISTARRVESRGTAGNPFSPFERSPFRDFFGEDFFERFQPRNQPNEGYLQHGMGTGVIVSDDGYILTNNHVIDGADEVTVHLVDDRELNAEVVGRDSKTDLAVVKIDAEALVPARLGDSENLEVGQWVVAIGSPFGLRASITAGIVSAKGRSRVGLADYEDFIQTDAAINPGNSGGPLVNLRGEVVGINTAILSRSGGNMGIGLAIPINMARAIMESLIDDGRVDRGFLGVSIQDLTEDLASSFGYDSTRGALIGDVTEDTPADEAGLRQGDIIVRYDGERVENVDDLRMEVASTPPGTRVELEIFRDGKLREVDVELGRLESGDEEGEEPAEADGQHLGLSVRTLTDETAERLGYEINPGGVVITAVEPFGPAARAGLRPREVILRVQGEEISSAEALRREVRKHDVEEGIRLTVLSGEAERFVVVKKRG